MISDDATLPGWVGSALAQRILIFLDRPRPTAELVEETGVTDSRVHSYLDRLAANGLVGRDEAGWHRTAAGNDAIGVAPPPLEVTEIPGSSAQDYRQAVIDIDLGTFGPDASWVGGEHAGRVQADRVAEFGERLQSLVNEYFGPESIDWSAPVKYGFRWVLSPVDLPPDEPG